MTDYNEYLPDYCKQVLSMLNEAGYECYVVGGAVRDIVMGKHPSDYDVTTSAFPEETISVLEKRGIRYFPTGLKHGTVMAMIGSEKVEITTFRIDGEYCDMRHPDSVYFTRDIDGDVARRDFTMNAMYLDKNGEITDKVGGLSDIENGIIRAVGDPDLRFREDALRIMRGLRFAAQTGFEIEEKTFRAMVESAPLLKKISGERIASELNSLVTAPYASSVIRRSVKILSVIIPELALCEKFDQKSRYHDRDVLEHILSTLDGIPVDKTLRTRDLSLALAALLHDIAKPNCFYIGPSGSGHMKGHPAQSAVIADRVLSELHYSTNIRNEVVRLVRYHNYFIPVQNYSVHRFMCNCGPGFVRRLFILQRADIMAHSPTGQKSVWRIAGMEEVSDGLLAKGVVYSVTDLKISGADLIEMGVEPGPGLGRILDDVFDAYLWGEVPNDHTELLEYVHRVIGNGSR